MMRPIRSIEDVYPTRTWVQYVYFTGRDIFIVPYVMGLILKEGVEGIMDYFEIEPYYMLYKWHSQTSEDISYRISKLHQLLDEKISIPLNNAIDRASSAMGRASSWVSSMMGMLW